MLLSELHLLVSIVAAFFITKIVANNFGTGWGIAAFFCVVIGSAFLAINLGIDLSSGCQSYGHAARDC